MGTIPQGYVFVAKADGVAAGLLNAADRIGADRKNGVRTVTGGYHVLEEIAQEYGATFAEVDVIETIPGTEDNEPIVLEGHPVDEGYDPAEHTVAEVQEYLDENPDQAGFVLDRERAGKARVTLTANKAEE